MHSEHPPETRESRYGAQGTGFRSILFDLNYVCLECHCMTPQLPVSQGSARAFGWRQFAAVSLFLLGAWLVIVGTTSLLSLHSNLSTRPGPSATDGGNLAIDSWWAGLLVGLPYVWLFAYGLLPNGLSLVIAGTGLMVAAIYCYFAWSQKTARHAVAAMVFLPGVWLILTLVIAIPDSDFLWRLIAIPLAFAIRYVAYLAADMVARRSGAET